MLMQNDLKKGKKVDVKLKTKQKKLKKHKLLCDVEDWETAFKITGLIAISA